jgi:hypothetical protein
MDCKGTKPTLHYGYADCSVIDSENLPNGQHFDLTTLKAMIGLT